MAHHRQQEFCRNLKKVYGKYFDNTKVLEVGSLQVSGGATNKEILFKGCDYTGIDVIKGDNVDIVSIAHEYKTKELFDVVFSTNTLEHDMHYKKTLKRMTELLKPDGLMFISAAYKWPEHGTKRYHPHQSGTTSFNNEWKDYYKNITPEDIKQSINLDDIFIMWVLRTEISDLQFWGIKKGV